MKIDLKMRKNTKYTVFTAILIIVGVVAFLKYDSRYDAAPLFSKQLDTRCPYYKDFLGRVFRKFEAGSLLVIFPSSTQWEKLRNIDNQNFRIVKIIDDGSKTQKCVATDGQYVVYRGLIINNADAESFQVIYPDYYKDKNNVYLRNKIIKGADPESFELINDERGSYVGEYAKDKNSVFYGLSKIEKADPNSFELFYDDSLSLKGRDKNGVYSGRRLETLYSQ